MKNCWLQYKDLKENFSIELIIKPLVVNTINNKFVEVIDIFWEYDWFFRVIEDGNLIRIHPSWLKR